MVIGNKVRCAGCGETVQSCVVPAYCFNCSPHYKTRKKEQQVDTPKTCPHGKPVGTLCKKCRNEAIDEYDLEEMAKMDKANDEAKARHLTPPMDATTYQELAGRTECDQRRALARIAGLRYDETANMPEELLIPVRCLHSAIGMMNELGEICELLQKWLWYDKGTPDPAKLGEEYGDLLWYHAEGLRALKLQMSTLMRQNLAKLQARYPDRYTDQHALNRDPVKEAEAMRRAAAVHPMASSFHEKYAKPGETLEQTAARITEEIRAATAQRNEQSQEEALAKLPGYKERKEALDHKADREQQEANDKPFVDNHGFGHADEKEGDANG